MCVRVSVGRECAARFRVYRRTRVRYVFSNSASRAGSSNLHIYSFTVIQSSLKLARTRVSARPARSVHARTHVAGSSLIHNSSKGLMELQSSRHSLTIFFLYFALLLSAFQTAGSSSGGGGGVSFARSVRRATQVKSVTDPILIIAFHETPCIRISNRSNVGAFARARVCVLIARTDAALLATLGKIISTSPR